MSNVCPHNTTRAYVAVAKMADRTAYDVRYSCRTEPPTYNCSINWPLFIYMFYRFAKKAASRNNNTNIAK